MIEICGKIELPCYIYVLKALCYGCVRYHFGHFGTWHARTPELAMWPSLGLRETYREAWMERETEKHSQF